MLPVTKDHSLRDGWVFGVLKSGENSWIKCRVFLKKISLVCSPVLFSQVQVSVLVMTLKLLGIGPIGIFLHPYKSNLWKRKQLLMVIGRTLSQFLVGVLLLTGLNAAKEQLSLPQPAPAWRPNCVLIRFQWLLLIKACCSSLLARFHLMLHININVHHVLIFFSSPLPAWKSDELLERKEGIFGCNEFNLVLFAFFFFFYPPPVGVDILKIQSRLKAAWISSRRPSLLIFLLSPCKEMQSSEGETTKLWSLRLHSFLFYKSTATPP